MLNFDYLEKRLRLASPPNFVYDFSRKIFLMFKGFSLKQIKTTSFESESPTLRILKQEVLGVLRWDEIFKDA